MGMEFDSHKLSKQEEAIIRILMKRELRRSRVKGTIREYTNLDLLQRIKELMEKIAGVKIEDE